MLETGAWLSFLLYLVIHCYMHANLKEEPARCKRVHLRPMQMHARLVQVTAHAYLMNKANYQKN